MKILIEHFKRLDWILIGSSLALICFGVLSLYSSSLARGDFSNMTKQLIFLGIGITLMFLISFFDYRLLRNDPYFILFLYSIGIFALIGLFLPFVHEIRGIRAWYRIGPISVDPIEYIKLILLILMAKYFSTRHIEAYRIRHIFRTGLYFLLPTVLIFLQPNLGSVLLLTIMWVVMLLVAGIPLKLFSLIVLTGIMIFAGSWQFLFESFQKDRILAFIEPEIDPLGIGWNQLQAKIAVGNGGVLGQGLGKGTQTQYGFLPEPQTDFIFAAIAEELGFVAVLSLLVFLAILVWRMLQVGLQSQENFPRLFTAGFVALIITQVGINVGMNLGLLPIIGLPFPLVSYGGSSLIFTYIGLGILQSIRTHRA
ncbi:MAG: FtsW/RodA/SpoVE family cell cycle protein [Patescibacteria group bacterium]